MIGGAATTHDARGNVTFDPMLGKTYAYSSENLLTGATGGVTLGYDPAMRLFQVTGAATSRFAYDGLALIAEYDAANAITKRFVHGPGVDEPLVEYDGSGTATRRYLHADRLGSIVAATNASGGPSINAYDEYGIPKAANVGRFQYTGQIWLGELGLYHYKARLYSPTLGRFLQTDPIGYEGGITLYAYADNDPVNDSDFMGTDCCYGPEGYRPPALDYERGQNAARLAYELSGAKDVVDFVEHPSLKGGFWAELAILPAGKAEKAFAGALKGAEQVARALGIKAAMKPSAKGIEKGVRWSEGNSAVRVMKGDSKAIEPFKREPYVKITGPKGEVYDSSGKVINSPKPSETPEAHIPLKDFDPKNFIGS